MERKRLLDLFCGAGGCAVGYDRAGFDVTGVDAAPQPNFPFAFIQGDALALPLEFMREFDVIHASPPCQAYSVATKRWAGLADRKPNLLGCTRELLRATGRPYVIENVPGSPMENAVLLCGTMFPPLRVIRHRLFECSFIVLTPPVHHIH